MNSVFRWWNNSIRAENRSKLNVVDVQNNFRLLQLFTEEKTRSIRITDTVGSAN